MQFKTYFKSEVKFYFYEQNKIIKKQQTNKQTNKQTKICHVLKKNLP